jgi:hypothetical protein
VILVILAPLTLSLYRLYNYDPVSLSVFARVILVSLSTIIMEQWFQAKYHGYHQYHCQKRTF